MTATLGVMAGVMGVDKIDTGVLGGILVGGVAVSGHSTVSSVFNYQST